MAVYVGGGGGGGVSLSLEAVPDAREKIYEKGMFFRGSRKWGENGNQSAMLRVLTVRSYVERVGKLRHVQFILT